MDVTNHDKKPKHDIQFFCKLTKKDKFKLRFLGLVCEQKTPMVMKMAIDSLAEKLHVTFPNFPD